MDLMQVFSASYSMLILTAVNNQSWGEMNEFWSLVDQRILKDEALLQTSQIFLYYMYL